MGEKGGVAGMGVGEVRRTSKQTKTSKKSGSLLLRWWVGREVKGGLGSQEALYRGVASQSPPRLCTVQTPDNYNSQREGRR